MSDICLSDKQTRLDQIAVEIKQIRVQLDLAIAMQDRTTELEIELDATTFERNKLRTQLDNMTTERNKLLKNRLDGMTAERDALSALLGVRAFMHVLLTISMHPFLLVYQYGSRLFTFLHIVTQITMGKSCWIDTSKNNFRGYKKFFKKVARNLVVAALLGYITHHIRIFPKPPSYSGDLITGDSDTGNESLCYSNLASCTRYTLGTNTDYMYCPADEGNTTLCGHSNDRLSLEGINAPRRKKLQENKICSISPGIALSTVLAVLIIVPAMYIHGRYSRSFL